MWYLIAQVTGFLAFPAALRMSGKETDIVIGIIMGYGLLIILVTYRGITTLIFALLIAVAIVAFVIALRRALQPVIRRP